MWAWSQLLKNYIALSTDKSLSRGSMKENQLRLPAFFLKTVSLVNVLCTQDYNFFSPHYIIFPHFNFMYMNKLVHKRIKIKCFRNVNCLARNV